MLVRHSSNIRYKKEKKEIYNYAIYIYPHTHNSEHEIEEAERDLSVLYRGLAIVGWVLPWQKGNKR